MSYNSFVYEVEDSIATMRLNDADRLNAQAGMGLEKALETEAKAQCMVTNNFREGYRAFMEKRAPQFNHP